MVPNWPISKNLGRVAHRATLLLLRGQCVPKPVAPKPRPRCDRAMKITPEIEIEDWELTEQFVRSGGPGGQNVNKVATAVELRFEAARSPNLPDPVKRRLERIAGRRWTRDGAIVIQVSDERSQARNRDLARTRLAELIRRAAVKPKRRIKTQVPYGQKRKRVDSKKRRGALKALRRGEDGLE